MSTRYAGVLESGRNRLDNHPSGSAISKTTARKKSLPLDLPSKAEVRVDGGKVVVAVDFERG